MWVEKSMQAKFKLWILMVISNEATYKSQILTEFEDFPLLCQGHRGVTTNFS